MKNRQTQKQPPCPHLALSRVTGYSLSLAIYATELEAREVVQWICQGSNPRWGHARCSAEQVKGSTQWAVEYHCGNERIPETA